ncbi:DUF4363 family protein [Desulfotomaculum varum]
MRLLAALSIMIVLLVVMGLWINHSITEAAHELSSHVQLISREVKQSDWQQANKQIDELEQKWRQIGSWWPAVLDHQEIDNIEFSLAKVKEYLAAGDRVHSLAQLSELNLMILHLPEKESLQLKNIL